jgi:hypothetical protein
MDQLISYGQMVCNKLVGAWGEWKGFEVPEIKYNYKSAPHLQIKELNS